jgi:thioredoxin 1
MKNLCALIIPISFLLAGCGCQDGEQIGATEFYSKMKGEPEALVLDVRTAEEFSKGYLPNAINIDWQGNNFDEGIKNIDKKKTVLVYCLSGGRSNEAAKHMRQLGYSCVWELKGGIMKWRAANLPEENSNANNSGVMTKADFEALLVSDKIVLVDFYADWCGPCKRMKPYLDEISNEMSDKVIVVRINADDNQAICKELGIDALPVLQVYKNKVLTWSNVGFIEKSEVVKQF